MFPEYRDLISELKQKDRHFEKLFDKHNELDEKINNIIDGVEVDNKRTVEELKKEKLKLKDEIYVILKKHSTS